MEIRAKYPSDIASAYSIYYNQLADLFISLVKPVHPRTVLEGGCGKGQLTLPIAKRFPGAVRLIGVDSSRGPYAGWLEAFALRVDQKGISSRVRLVKSDVRKMQSIKSESIDVIVSNELMCDLPLERQLGAALKEFYRVLRPGGIMVHGEWQSSSDIKSRHLIVRHSPTWNPDQLFNQLRKASFQDVKISYFETTIKFDYEAAIQELRTWGASERMIRKNRSAIRKNGIRLPLEHIVQCRK